jgi:hypothetical protein
MGVRSFDFGHDVEGFGALADGSCVAKPTVSKIRPQASQQDPEALSTA